MEQGQGPSRVLWGCAFQRRLEANGTANSRCDRESSKLGSSWQWAHFTAEHMWKVGIYRAWVIDREAADSSPPFAERGRGGNGFDPCSSQRWGTI